MLINEKGQQFVIRYADNSPTLPVKTVITYRCLLKTEAINKGMHILIFILFAFKQNEFLLYLNYNDLFHSSSCFIKLHRNQDDENFKSDTTLLWFSILKVIDSSLSSCSAFNSAVTFNQDIVALFSGLYFISCL